MAGQHMFNSMIPRYDNDDDGLKRELVDRLLWLRNQYEFVAPSSSPNNLTRRDRVLAEVDAILKKAGL